MPTVMNPDHLMFRALITIRDHPINLGDPALVYVEAVLAMKEVAEKVVAKVVTRSTGFPADPMEKRIMSLETLEAIESEIELLNWSTENDKRICAIIGALVS